ncbi:MAG: AgmX/PglI C-terminal domain-containing protein [Kofleriaceae bacterium]
MKTKDPRTDNSLALTSDSTPGASLLVGDVPATMLSRRASPPERLGRDHRSIPFAGPALLALSTVAVAVGCGGAGMGAATRADIQARMQTVQAPVQACYAEALKKNRRLKGMVTIELVAEASTGQFKNVIFRRDEVNDPSVRQCIVAEVSKLKLEKPTSTTVSINYPFRFMPNN